MNKEPAETVAEIRQRRDDARRQAVEVAERQAASEAQAKLAAKLAERRQAAGLTAPEGWGDGKRHRRFHPEEIEAFATYWRNKYAAYGNPEIEKLGEEKMAAALRADGYEVPPKKPVDRLQQLLKQASKG
ncbi:MAG TPA: hypothetical protein VGG59_02075, partial [Acidobacteriaceae bacterium]|jgi:hypothetical protein